MADETLTKKEQNEIRCVAAQIIHQLYEAENVSQLRLLKMQCDRSLEELEKKGAVDGQ